METWTTMAIYGGREHGGGNTERNKRQLFEIRKLTQELIKAANESERSDVDRLYGEEIVNAVMVVIVVSLLVSGIGSAGESGNGAEQLSVELSHAPSAQPRTW